MKKLIAIIVVLAVGFLGSSLYIERLNSKMHEDFKRLASTPLLLQNLQKKYNNNPLLQGILKNNQKLAYYYGSYYYLNLGDLKKGFLSSSAPFTLMAKSTEYNEAQKILEGNIIYYNLPLPKRFKAVFTKEGLEKIDKELAEAIKGENLLEVEGFKTLFDWEVRIKSADFSHKETLALSPINLILLLDSKNPLLLKSSKLDFEHFKLQYGKNEAFSIHKLSSKQDFKTPSHLFSTDFANSIIETSYKEAEFSLYDAYSNKIIKSKLQNLYAFQESFIEGEKLALKTQTNVEFLSLENGTRIKLQDTYLNTYVKNIDIKAWQNLSSLQSYLQNILESKIEANTDLKTTLYHKKINLVAHSNLKDSKLSFNAKTYAKSLNLQDLLQTDLKEANLTFGVNNIPLQTFFDFAKTEDLLKFTKEILKSNMGMHLGFNANINQKNFELFANLKTAKEGINLNSKIISEGSFSDLQILPLKGWLDNLDKVALVDKNKSKMDMEVIIKHNGTTFLEPKIKMNGKILENTGGNQWW